MNIEDLVKLQGQAEGELTIVQSNLAVLDEQIKTLRAQRRAALDNIAKVRGALKFAALAFEQATKTATPSPALERAKAALAAAQGKPNEVIPVSAAELEALIEHSTGAVEVTEIVLPS